MSLTEQFKSLTETKILMLEVSKAKRNALLEKIAKHFHKERGEDELYDRVMWLLENKPIVVERTYGELDKLEGITWTPFPEGMIDFYKKRFDIDNIIEEKYQDLTVEYEHEKWWGLISLVGCVKLFKILEGVDPTGNMKYGNWLVDTVLTFAIEEDMIGGRGSHIRKNDPDWNTRIIMEQDGVFFEDLPKLGVYLKAYHEMKQKNKLPDKYKDINKVIDNFETDDNVRWDDEPFYVLNKITKSYRTQVEGDYFEIVDDKLQEGKDYEVLADDIQGFIIYKPETQKANSVLGMNTEWCTTYGEHCLNPEYQDRSPNEYDELYIFVNKNNPQEKYQYDHETLMFMDEEDSPVDRLAFFDEYYKLGEILIENEDDIRYPFNPIPNTVFADRGDKTRHFKKDDKGYYLEYESFKDLALQFLTEEEYVKLMRQKGEQYIEDVLDDHFQSPSGFIYRNNKVKVYLSTKMAVLWILMYNEIVDEDMTVLKPNF